MRVRIDSSVLGTPSSLAVGDDGSAEWSDEECEVHLGRSSPGAVTIEDLARMQGMPTDTFLLSDPAQLSAFASLGLAPDRVPWALALGRERFSSRLRTISQGIQDVLCDTEVQRYIETYRIGRKLLESLLRPAIDVDLLRSYRSADSTSASCSASLLSFSPDEPGRAPPIVYDSCRTSTGRLTVTSGPRVLTLAREHRDIIRSTLGGSILEVDFVSLEPRFALHLGGVRPPADIYEDIRSRSGSSATSRRDIKLAVISALYGSSLSGLSETLGSRAAAQDLVDEVSRLFQVERLAGSLRSHMSSHGGRLHNHFGRPLTEVAPSDKDPILISHYVQSSCVDVALMGFTQLCQRVKHLGVRPIYVIHDAVLLDVPAGAESALREECQLGVDLETGHFELGVKRVS